MTVPVKAASCSTPSAATPASIAARQRWRACGLPGEQEYACAPTPALALCLALVLAKAAQMEEPKNG